MNYKIKPLTSDEKLDAKNVVLPFVEEELKDGNLKEAYEKIRLADLRGELDDRCSNAPQVFAHVLMSMDYDLLSFFGNRIPQNAFWGCSWLLELEIPEGVDIIGSNSFRACDHLTHVRVPDSATQLNVGCFTDAGDRSGTNPTISIPSKFYDIDTLESSGLMSSYFTFKCRDD